MKMRRLFRIFGICFHEWRPLHAELTEKLWCHGIECKHCGERRSFYD